MISSGKMLIIELVVLLISDNKDIYNSSSIMLEK